MGYWKCKKCGNTTFMVTETIDKVKKGVKFDKSCNIEKSMIYFITSERHIACERCMNTGDVFNKLESIAEYIEEE